MLKIVFNSHQTLINGFDFEGEVTCASIISENSTNFWLSQVWIYLLCNFTFCVTIVIRWSSRLNFWITKCFEKFMIKFRVCASPPIHSSLSKLWVGLFDLALLMVDVLLKSSSLCFFFNSSLHAVRNWNLVCERLNIICVRCIWKWNKL